MRLVSIHPNLHDCPGLECAVRLAAENAFGRASLSSATCPVNEGYPDCQADGSVPHSLTPKRSTTLFLCEEWD